MGVVGSGDRNGPSSRQRSGRHKREAHRPTVCTANSKTLTGRGSPGGVATSRPALGRGHAQIPALPSQGVTWAGGSARRGGRARPEAASSLLRRERGGAGAGTGSPRGLGSEQVSEAAGASPFPLLPQVWPGVFPFRRRERRGPAAILCLTPTSAGVSAGCVVCSPVSRWGWRWLPDGAPSGQGP